jgi:B12-binding domain/radical SAM domain protein
LASPDLILLHSPSVYDFRQKTILFGPVSDLVPSSPVFDMYPVGFASMAEYLEKRGFRVRIVNLAARMLMDSDFDVERALKKLRAPVYGIDLHWLPHCHGAVEIARLLKQLHPQSKVVIGGLSASYYHRELLEYPEVDFVIRGDSSEKPLHELMVAIRDRGDLDKIPNLTWRDEEGKTQENPFSHVPVDLSDIMVDYYDNSVRSIFRYRDFGRSFVPFKHWLKYPITAVITCRGCTQNCVICGGSAFGYRRVCNREETVYRSPEAVVHDIRRISRYTRGPIFLLGDIRQPGEDYADQLLRLLKEEGKKNQIILELFTPASREFLRRVGEACPNFCLEISPESHDPEVRRASGKHYSAEDLENTLTHALEAGCGRLDLFYMIGVPKQTPESVLATAAYSEALFRDLGKDHRFSCFISPLAPFLDPGSLAFEQPERHGYRSLWRTLEEHRQALLAPSWKYTLSYETEWLNRDQIADLSYEAGRRLNSMKAQFGLISKETADATARRIETARTLMRSIDDILARGNGRDVSADLTTLKTAVERASISTVCEKRELDLPVNFLKFRPLNAIRSWISGPR